MKNQESTEYAVNQDEAFVADYLLSNPEFFLANRNLLTRIRIPHESGKAVSLVERQLGLYRDKCNNLEAHLHDLVQVANENESLNRKIHSLACKIIACRTQPELEAVLRQVLQQDFRVGRLAFHFSIAAMADSAPGETYEPGELQLVRESMKGENILCGRLSQEQKAGLFGSDSQSIDSAALIWLSRNETEYGLMVLGSEQADHFSVDKGVVFLEQLRDLVSHKVASFIH
ncbi:MAG: DUF484 family protein [Gammaproteobacteria bacterium]|nr:DUF484 family protein [Gammaproteobacteria bacterium]